MFFLPFVVFCTFPNFKGSAIMEVKPNTVVKFHYTVRDKETGEVYDSSYQRGEPLEVVIGANQIIPGLEKRLIGLKKGDEALIEVPAVEAYGAKDPELIQALPREYFEGIELRKGLPLQMRTPDGRVIQLTVVDFDDKTVTVDLNHPLAGRDLVFEVKIEDVKPLEGEKS